MLDYVHHIAYVVSDMEQAVGLFRETFELELIDRRVFAGDRAVEMASFRCGRTLIELLRPINHPALSQFLNDHGPGLHHVAYAVKDLPGRIEQLRQKGVTVNPPFVAPIGWKIAYFDLNNEHLALLRSQYHGDHLAEAAPDANSLRDALGDWTDWDGAAFRVAVCLGLMRDEPELLPGRAKHLFWSNNPVGNALYRILDELVAAGVLETCDEPDRQYRWNSAFHGSWEGK